MSKKIIVLIIASLIGLICLSFIQGYLIKNTYSLEKKFFKEKAEKEIGKITAHNSPLDSLHDVFGDVFIKDLDTYNAKRISKSELITRLKELRDSINPVFIKEYDKEAKLKNIPHKLKYHKTLKHIILYNEEGVDTIFKAAKNKEYTLLGYEFKNDPDLFIGKSSSQTERSFEEKKEGETKKITYKILFQVENNINIDDWNAIILNKMKGLLIFSVLIFVFVIGILFYSIKSLITQKKIADVKTDFINNITHEFKTPLATLSLATKMLNKSEEVHSSEILKGTVHTIERQNNRLQKLVDQVLHNSIGYKEIDLHKEPVAIREYLTTLLNDFELTLTNKEIILQKEIIQTDKKINIDAFYMTTAILNVLENAVKYGGDQIMVTTNIENENLILSVIDNGIGISKKHLNNLFDKFYRVDNTEVHNVKGLGLGLYYSNQILKAHEGLISVKSEKEQGSTFKIQIPL
ncbi:sensor histidine kinase [Tenacibaculum sp. M341]|uniref:sensor histidine kinase n=1 Tax=Tenacibaculum sp. M341 TaxID=2530339 RepID=UPI00104F96B2|nr:HAMP domain-containing sensor histidine kinase [Tenacibaculum sp. M341]TCI84638.1 HAMP domain-containing histidine kinase [Tenacibaculum sp. M341]